MIDAAVPSLLCDKALADYVLQSANTMSLILAHAKLDHLHTAMTIFKEHELTYQFFIYEESFNECLRMDMERYPFVLRDSIRSKNMICI
jgi:hypothetical protein